MQKIAEQETKEQREHRVITRSIDNYVSKYQASTNDSERAKVDNDVIALLGLLVPSEKIKEYWDYYEITKTANP